MATADALAKRAAEETYLMSLEGSTAVYSERRTVTLARITDISTHQDIFHAKATPTGPPGLNMFEHPCWGFGARWGYFHINPGYVAGGAYSNWCIFTAPEVIERVTEMLKVANGRHIESVTPVTPKELGSGVRITGIAHSTEHAIRVWKYLADLC